MRNIFLSISPHAHLTHSRSRSQSPLRFIPFLFHKRHVYIHINFPHCDLCNISYQSRFNHDAQLSKNSNRSENNNKTKSTRTRTKTESTTTPTQQRTLTNTTTTTTTTWTMMMMTLTTTMTMTMMRTMSSLWRNWPV